MLISDITELEIEMTTLCNGKCPLCYRNYKSFKTSIYNNIIIRPFKDLISQLNTYISLNYVMIVGSMSEPTLCPYFIELIKYLKRRNIKIEICTNGDTRDDIFWKELSSLLDSNDLVFFTICGSTQKIHEKYRKNTSLKKILHNASVFRDKYKKNDYAQCIRFNYNSDNLDSNEFKILVKQFSNVYMTETFYPKDISNYISSFNIDDFLPPKQKIIQYNKLKILAKDSYKMLQNTYAECQSIQFNRQQMDVFGNIYPCYLFLEASNGNKWDNDYKKIKLLQYECCIYCSNIIKKYCKKYHLEYII